jgi:hypothetical protein
MRPLCAVLNPPDKRLTHAEVSTDGLEGFLTTSESLADRNHVSFSEASHPVALAISLATLTIAVLRVVSERAQKEMSGIETRRNITGVKYALTVGDRLPEYLETYAVDSSWMVVNRYHPVAVLVASAQPKPMTIANISLSYEPFLIGGIGPIRGRANPRPSPVKLTQAPAKPWPRAVVDGAHIVTVPDPLGETD